MDAAKSSWAVKGFWIHPQSIVDPDVLARAACGLNDVRDVKYDTGETPAGRTWNPGDDPHAFCKIEQPQIANTALREILRSPRLGELASMITGAKTIQIWWVQGLIKPGVGNSVSPAVVGWHQDRFYWDAWEKGSELFTAWLALSDVTTESGPMMFVPGSHQWGLIDGSDFFAQNLSASLTRIQIPAGQEWCEEGGALSPGGVSFHHQLVFHGSGANQTSHPRCGLAIHLRTEHSKISPDHQFAQFLNRPEICPTIYDNTVKQHFILSRLKSIAPRWMVARDAGDRIA